MRHGFAGERAVDHDETEADAKVELTSHHSGGEDEVPEHRLIGRRGFTDARDDLFGHDQQVHRRLRLNVVENDTMLILVLDACGNLAVNDFLKDGFHEMVKGVRRAWARSRYKNNSCKFDPRTVRAAASSRMNARM